MSCKKTIGPFRCCSLIHGDSLKLIRQIPKGVIGLCATDPPYGIDYQSNMRVRSVKFKKLKNDDNDSRLKMYAWVWRVLKMHSALVSFCSFKNYAEDYTELDLYYDIRNTIIWCKGGGGIGDLKHSLSTDYEMAIVAHKGNCKVRGKRDGSLWFVGKVNPSAMTHATQKPVALFEKIISKFSDAGDVVFDPYSGSGASLVAAKRLGRHYLGFELDEKYVRVAEDALDAVEPVPTMNVNGNSKFEYFDVLEG